MMRSEHINVKKCVSKQHYFVSVTKCVSKRHNLESTVVHCIMTAVSIEDNRYYKYGICICLVHEADKANACTVSMCSFRFGDF